MKTAKKKSAAKKVVRKKRIPKADVVKSTSKSVTVDVSQEEQGGIDHG
ncbi:hypothetical protein [Leptospira licerasiae]